MTERRYTDQEVAAILRAATEASTTGAGAESSDAGLTLRELQAIAREVDIAPDAVARAARSLDASPAAASPPTFLGLPIAVQRTVALDRRLTDAEWELLVVELREVFRARGTMRAQGSLREWSNGNLHAMLEPTSTGHRLRLGTTKGNVRRLATAGTVTLAMAAAVAAASLANGTFAAAGAEVAAMATIGVAMIASGAASLPAWARRRRAQMDGIVERLTQTAPAARE